MAKKTLNTYDDNKPEKFIKASVAPVMFRPTDTQRKVKAKFWNRFQPGPLFDANNVTSQVVRNITGSTGIANWWNKPGFRPWFLNQDEAKDTLEYLYQKALYAAEAILDDPEEKGNVKVQLIKTIAELANKVPGRGEVERLTGNADIDKMEEHELRAYLKKHGVTLAKEKEVIDAAADTISEPSEDDNPDGSDLQS